ncbi:hypothetical protein AMECASPLE_000557 [Ameca splendens]|uniref:Secreted protein n=1 Tax=Ameca splendens TaxID=208324 RepID=A0ABV0Z6L0_9TELE
MKRGVHKGRDRRPLLLLFHPAPAQPSVHWINPCGPWKLHNAMQVRAVLGASDFTLSAGRRCYNFAPRLGTNRRTLQKRRTFVAAILKAFCS